MAIGISPTVRSTMATAILSALDAGAGAGKIRLYSGARPAMGGSPTTQLAELTLSKPAGTVSNGVLTFAAITPDSSADATGTATWARIVDGAGATVVDASVTATGGGGDIQINSTAISIGQKVSCSSAAIVVGGA